MTGRWLSRLGVALVVVVLVGSITAMPVAATDRPAMSTPTPTASTHAPAAVLTTPLLAADGTAATPVTPLSTTPEITITVTDSSNGQDTATTPVTIEQDGDATPGDVPQQLADEDVSAASYSAVVGDDSQLGAGNLAGAIQSWAGDDGSEQGFIGETNVGAGELSQMINYWSSEIAG